MFNKNLSFTVLICVLVAYGECRPEPEEPTTTEATTWDKIKQGVEHGWHVVYDETHCAFHKVKELVKDHDHAAGDDPCVNKPYKQVNTTQKSLVLVAEEKIPVTTRP